MVKIAVNGAAGRMGSRIIALAKEQSKNFSVVQAFDLDGKFESLKPYAESSGKKKLKCDVLIDFSGPEGADGSAEAARISKKAVVIGSTGFDDRFLVKVRSIARSIPVVFSSNMSVGVNVMLALVAEAAKNDLRFFQRFLRNGFQIRQKSILLF